MASKITAYSREGADAKFATKEEVAAIPAGKQGPPGAPGEKGDAHRPERCPTCGCEIVNRKEDQ